MASQDWIEIYRSYTDDELAEELNDLKKQLKSAGGITGQGSGSVNYSRDLLHLQGRLHACVRVRGERSSSSFGPKANGHWGVADFSGVRV